MAYKLNVKDSIGQNVYVRPVAVDSLPERLRAQVDGLETIYSLNGDDGRQIALVVSRE